MFASFSGFYYRISSFRLSEGDVAFAVLHNVENTANTGRMVKMNVYFMNTGYTGRLFVSISKMTRRPEVVYSSPNPMDQDVYMDWEEVKFCIPPGTLSLWLMAIQDDERASDIVVDNIYMTDEHCNNSADIPGVYSIFH